MACEDGGEDEEQQHDEAQAERGQRREPAPPAQRQHGGGEQPRQPPQRPAALEVDDLVGAGVVRVAAGPGQHDRVADRRTAACWARRGRAARGRAPPAARRPCGRRARRSRCRHRRRPPLRLRLPPRPLRLRFPPRPVLACARRPAARVARPPLPAPPPARARPWPPAPFGAPVPPGRALASSHRAAWVSTTCACTGMAVAACAAGARPEGQSSDEADQGGQRGRRQQRGQQHPHAATRRRGGGVSVSVPAAVALPVSLSRGCSGPSSWLCSSRPSRARSPRRSWSRRRPPRRRGFGRPVPLSRLAGLMR